MTSETPSAAWPSPYATHADLSALRREIKDDIRLELSQQLSRLRADIAAIRHDEHAGSTRRQWLVTTYVSASSVALAAWAMWHK